MDAQLLKQKLNRAALPECQAAVLVPLLQTADGLSVLMEERATTLRFQPGEVCLPGGRIEPGETPSEAALREAWEETGLDPAAVQLLGTLPLQMAPSGRRVRPLVGLVPGVAVGNLRPSEDEVAGLFTVPVQFLEENPPERYRYDLIPDHYEALPAAIQKSLHGRPRTMDTHVWQYNGHTIWGLTARILMDLMKL